MSEYDIINQRFNEHETVKHPTLPSVSKCSATIISFLNAVAAKDESSNAKRYAAIQILDSYKFQLERIPQIQECLTVDLDSVCKLQEKSKIQYNHLCEVKSHLEVELQNALQELKEMNEVEKKSIEVNKYPSQQKIHTSIESMQKQIKHIEEEIQRLKQKMQDDNNKLHEFYEAFVNLKNEILGIEKDDEDTAMDVEE